jgi:heme/copper-type cytochrome/quinol oxidase subunit 4
MDAVLKPEYLTAAAGLVMSVLFTYIPLLNTWYAKLDKKVKPALMLGLLAVVSLAIFGLSCWQLSAPDFPMVVCSEKGAWALFKVFAAAVVINQATYLISPVPDAVEKAKASRSKG